MTDTQAFTGLVLDRRDGEIHAQLRELTIDDLPEGDVVVSVAYSGLNYKDGLAVTGKGKVVRNYPMVPGIDFSGTVVSSRSTRLSPGDRVILTGWGVGESHWGGFAELARVPADWLVSLPERMSLLHAMTLGTAGLTAMLAVTALEEHGVTPDRGEVVVTGAGGGLGSAAVAILSEIGYSVTASTGRGELHDYLRSLGAGDVIDRQALASKSDRPLESARWAGAVDAVGGTTLEGLLRTLAERSTVAVCGNAAGAEFCSSVFPFILRGVTMVGIESVRVPFAERERAWERLAQLLPVETLDRMTQVAPLNEVPGLAEKILAGEIRGRMVIEVEGE